MYTDPGSSRKPVARARAPFTGSRASLLGPGAAEGDGAGAPVAEGLEVELRPRLVVALDRQQEVDQVGDLLVVHGAAVADAPGGHGRRRPALLDGLPGDL